MTDSAHALIFDMDGVLLDTERYYFYCWRKSAQEAGYKLYAHQALAVRSCFAPLAQRYFRRIFGEEFDYYGIRDRRRSMVNEMIGQEGLTAKPGIRPLLAYCQAQGIQVAVATATPIQYAHERLEGAGLGGLFPTILGGDCVKRGKPYPDIYLEAAKQLGLPPERCAAVEDSPNGIIAAFSAGCVPIMVSDLTPAEECIKPLLYGMADDLEAVIPFLGLLWGSAKEGAHHA